MSKSYVGWMTIVGIIFSALQLHSMCQAETQAMDQDQLKVAYLKAGQAQSAFEKKETERRIAFTKQRLETIKKNSKYGKQNTFRRMSDGTETFTTPNAKTKALAIKEYTAKITDYENTLKAVGEWSPPLIDLCERVSTGMIGGLSCQGNTGVYVKVLQVMDDGQMLVHFGDDDEFFLTGVPTNDIVDDTRVRLLAPFIVKGTKTYGASTHFELRMLSEKEVAACEEYRENFGKKK